MRLELGNELKTRLIIKGIVLENGNLEDIKIVQGISPQVDKRVIEILENIPKWNPGFRNGEQVKLAISKCLDKNKVSSN